MKPTINILGTEYRIEFRELGKEECDGFCDSTEHLIVIRSDNVNEVGNMEELTRKNLRHEVIHAFMYESGLGCNWKHSDQFGQDETVVDWFAIQSPKIYKAFQELEIL